MRWVLLCLILFVPLASASGLSGFGLDDDGNIIGTYLPVGLQGTISCFDNDVHIMDIIYKNNSIEFTIHYFDTLDEIISRNPFLKDDITESLMKEALSSFSISDTTSFSLNYEDVTVELHDTPTRFLRIKCDKIQITNITYNISEFNDYKIQLEKNNFNVTLFSSTKFDIINNTIITKKELMLVSFAYIKEKELENAFTSKTIGGEITINSYDHLSVDYISYFGNVSVSPYHLDEEKIILSVSGDEKSSGRIIKINLGNEVCKSDAFKLFFDGIPIQQASNFNDILNPDDDGIIPEYYLLSPLQNQEGSFILITIPHFSDHQISIEFVVENTAAQTVAIFLGVMVIALAGFYLFKK